MVYHTVCWICQSVWIYVVD